MHSLTVVRHHYFRLLIIRTYFTELSSDSIASALAQFYRLSDYLDICVDLICL